MFDGEEFFIGQESIRKSTLTKLFWFGLGCVGVLLLCVWAVNIWSTGRVTGQVQPTPRPVVYVTEQEVTREVAVTQQMVVYVTATPNPEPIDVTPTFAPTHTSEPIDATPTFASTHQEALVAYYPFRQDAADVTGQQPAGEVDNVYFSPPEENFIPGVGNYLNSSSTITLSNNLASEQFTFVIHLLVDLSIDEASEPDMVYLLGTQPDCHFAVDGFNLIYDLRPPFPQLVLNNGTEQLFVQQDLVDHESDISLVHVYLTAVFSETQFKLYLNGELMGVKDGSYTPNDAPFIIRPRLITSDCQPSPHAEQFALALNRLLFYNYPLSDSEVAALHQTYRSSQP